MNNIIENMCTRRSVRKYRPDTVPTDVINEIIKAGLYAASGRNGQSAVIVAVTDKTVRDKLARVNASFMRAESDPFYGAPVVLVSICKYNLTKSTTFVFFFDEEYACGAFLLLLIHTVFAIACRVGICDDEVEQRIGEELVHFGGGVVDAIG